MFLHLSFTGGWCLPLGLGGGVCVWVQGGCLPLGLGGVYIWVQGDVYLSLDTPLDTPSRLVEMVIEAGGTTHILECILVDHIFQPSLSVLTFISLYIMIVSQKLERRKIKKLLTESKKHDLRL